MVVGAGVGIDWEFTRVLIAEEVTMIWEFSHFSAGGVMHCSAFASADISFDVGLVGNNNSLFFDRPFFASTVVGPSSTYIDLFLIASAMASYHS